MSILKKMSEELEKARDIADNKFSIEEICDIWYSLYGEEMEEDYPGFVDELKQRIS